MVFIGGAVLAEVMKDKEQFWFTKEQYLEKGIDRLMEEKYGVGTNRYYSNVVD